MSIPNDPGQNSPLLWSRDCSDRCQPVWKGRLQAYIEEQEPDLSVLASPKLDLKIEASETREGPLAPLLVGVKDIIRVDGFDIRAGSLLPSHLWQGTEAELVTRIRKLGGMPIAKTATTEFAYFEPGPTRNPWHQAYTPGGSSSGSAAGVAAGYFDIAIGTQTVGSVIRPAAFCGVCGFKPSLGRIPLPGVIIFSHSVDHLGFFTRDWDTMLQFCEHVMSLPVELVGGKPDLRFGIVSGEYMDQADADMKDQIRAFGRRLEEAGWNLSTVDLPTDNIYELNQRHQDLIAYEFGQAHVEWFDKYHYLYRPKTAALIEKGKEITQSRYRECRESCQTWRKTVTNYLSDADIDLLISPAAVGTAPFGLTYTGDPVLNLPWTHAGLPVTSIPLGLIKNENEDWLPIGAQLTAGFGGDALLLKASQLIAQRLDLAPQKALEN